MGDKNIKKIAHIGIAVNSIDEALPFYTDALGLTLEGTEDVESEAVRVAFLKIGETRFELLEPLNDSSAIKGYLDKKGQGIHHIALDVDDIDARLDDLKTKGIRLINEQAKPGAHDSQVAFLHPKTAHGVLFELVQQKESGDA